MNNSGTLKRNTLIAIGVVGAVIMSYGIVVVAFSHRMTTIPEHHLLHAGMAIGAGMLGIALAALLPVRSWERSWWSIPAVLAPAVGLFLMWPSAYAYLMGNPLLHVLDHVGIALSSVVAVFAAQVYVRGLGWPMLILVVGMDAAAAGGFGVIHAPGQAMNAQPMSHVMQSSVAPGTPAVATPPSHAGK
jgi:hypothetical protein